jgi:hypothetical protein
LSVEYDCPQTGTADGVVEVVLDTGADETDSDEDEPETETDVGEEEYETGTDNDADKEALPRVMEPGIADEERTKPDGIKLRDEEKYGAADVVLNKPPGLEAVHADT